MVRSISTKRGDYQAVKFDPRIVERISRAKLGTVPRQTTERCLPCKNPDISRCAIHTLGDFE